jgi:RNA polymerase sigma-70 factor (ECF subfamily)
MNVSKLKENLLLLKLRKKDPEAFARLYDLYVTPIYRFIYFKVSNRQDAEDLTSEVFLKTWQYIVDSEQGVENLRALLYRTAKNLVIDFYRKKSNKDIIREEEFINNIEDERQQNLLAQIETATEMKNMEVILRKMKSDYREVLILRFIEELSINEIADVLDKSKGAVRVLIHRAIKVARELLQENGK